MHVCGRGDSTNQVIESGCRASNAYKPNASCIWKSSHYQLSINTKNALLCRLCVGHTQCGRLVRPTMAMRVLLSQGCVPGMRGFVMSLCTPLSPPPPAAATASAAASPQQQQQQQQGNRGDKDGPNPLNNEPTIYWSLSPFLAPQAPVFSIGSHPFQPLSKLLSCCLCSPSLSLGCPAYHSRHLTHPPSSTPRSLLMPCARLHQGPSVIPFPLWTSLLARGLGFRFRVRNPKP